MIGSDILNSSGYGGKGMRIAILDTGILVTHPNFAALPDDKLDDPITRQSVDDIWYTLNAGKSTPKLNRSYYNTKLPFIFNYATADLTYRTHMQVRITERMLQVLLRQTRLKEVRLSVLLRTHSLSLCRFPVRRRCRLGNNTCRNGRLRKA